MLKKLTVQGPWQYTDSDDVLFVLGKTLCTPFSFSGDLALISVQLFSKKNCLTVEIKLISKTFKALISFMFMQILNFKLWSKKLIYSCGNCLRIKFYLVIFIQKKIFSDSQVWKFLFLKIKIYQICKIKNRILFSNWDPAGSSYLKFSKF